MSYPVTDTDNNELAPASGGQLDIKKFVFKLIGFLPWILLSVFISYTGARLYLRYAPKLHHVSSYLLIKDNEESSPDYNVLRELGVMPGSKEVQNQMDIIQSYELSAGIVDSLNLQLKLFAEGRISSAPIYGKNSPISINTFKDSSLFTPATYKLFIYDDHFDLINNDQKFRHLYNDTFQLSGKTVWFTRNRNVKANIKGYNLQVEDKHSVAVALRGKIAVTKLHDMGGIVEIAMLDESPARAINIINKLMEAYNTAGITDKNIVSYKTNNFLGERVDAVSSELDDLELKAEAFKRNNHITDISTAGGQYLTEATKYDGMQVEQTGQLKLLENLERFIKNSKGYTDIIPSENGLSEPTLGNLISNYNEQVLNYQQQIKISTQKDPIVERLKNQINDIKGNILKNIQSIREGYQTRLNQIDSRYDKFENLLSALPEKEREFLKLKRQIGVKEQLYLYLLQKKEETQLSLASTINNTRVVDYAFDQGVVLPKDQQIITFSILLGIIIPIVIMLLLDFFDNKINDRKQIDEGTRAPIIGELSFRNEMSKRIVNAKSRSSFAEQFRLIGTNLRYLAADQESKVILITSFTSGEGKSFLSTNLSGSLAAGNVKILLIEIDLRKPKLSKYLNIQPPHGLTDYLVNDYPFDKIVTRLDDLGHVDVITSGPVPPNPGELLMHHRMEKLIKYARENYDYVILDSSPVGLVADGFLASKFADTTLFVLRHEYSRKTTIGFVERLLAEQKLPRLNLVVNGIKERQGLVYGYGYSYGYGYGYGYTYGYSYGSSYYDDEKKPERWKKLLGRLRKN